MKEQTRQHKYRHVLPKSAYLSFSHCNIPAPILGSPEFQQYPVPLHLDSTACFHKVFFDQLDKIDHEIDRAGLFKKYMEVYFHIKALEQLHQNNMRNPNNRINTNYLTILRGWLFDSDNREGAILKGWVESRFGLLPKWHKEKITDADDLQYRIYLHERMSGIYNSNALESQLDLVYSYCQFELLKKYKTSKHITLYRGINRQIENEIKQNNNVLLLNNINSFSSTRERADEFGDTTIEVKVPIFKVFYYSGLLPGILQGEDENIIIGGNYKVKISSAIPL